MHCTAVCCSCGRTIEKNFVYCPWCGASVLAAQNNASAPESEETLFQQVRCISSDNRDRRICRLEYSLNQLEADLSRLISQSEC